MTVNDALDLIKGEYNPATTNQANKMADESTLLPLFLARVEQLSAMFGVSTNNALRTAYIAGLTNGLEIGRAESKTIEGVGSIQ